MKEERVLTIGLALTQSPTSGGGYTYERAFVEALAAHPIPGVRWVLLILDAPLDPEICRLPFPAFGIRTGLRERLILHAAPFAALGLERKLRRWLPSSFTSTLDHQKVDLVWFLSLSRLAWLLTDKPYVMTVWDLCHRDWPEFPEVSADRAFETREEILQRTLTKAIAVIVESVSGREALVHRYLVDPKRVRILPFIAEPLPVGAAPDSSCSDLPSRFLFYPAQYWAHKNHVFLLEGLAGMRKQGDDIPLICCGSDKGNLAYLKDRALALGVADLVTFLGFVSRERLTQLYSAATALAMPTYFGPTNIPPLEAWGVGCPVIYSDLPGLREQVDGAGWLVDLSDPSSLGRRLTEIEKDHPERERRVAEGRRRHAAAGAQEVVAEVARVVNGYAMIRRRWA